MGDPECYMCRGFTTRAEATLNKIAFNAATTFDSYWMCVSCCKKTYKPSKPTVKKKHKAQKNTLDRSYGACD